MRQGYHFFTQLFQVSENKNKTTFRMTNSILRLIFPFSNNIDSAKKKSKQSGNVKTGNGMANDHSLISAPSNVSIDNLPLQNTSSTKKDAETICLLISDQKT